MRKILAGIIVSMALLPTPITLWAQERAALIIGNSIYANGPDLRNPVSDARAMATALSDLSYEVTYGENLNYGEMSRLMLDFAEKSQDAALVVVYFAGHGVQIDGVTYLMPTDAMMRSKEDLITSFTLNELLDLLRNQLRASVVLVDACRNNPIYETVPSRSFDGAPTSSAARFDLPYGMVIGYASAPGALAYDGPKQNSPYAQALLKYIGSKDLDVELMLRRVRSEVVQLTGGAQVPWTQSSLLGEVRLAPTDPPLQMSQQIGTNEGGGAKNPLRPVGQPQPLRAILPNSAAARQDLRALLCQALLPPLPLQCKG